MIVRTDRSTNDSDRFNQAYFKQTYGCDGLTKFGMHWWSARMYASIADRWLHRTGGKRLLEVGCGHGFVLNRLEDRYETFGVDFSEYAVRQAKRFAPKSKCFSANIEKRLPTELACKSFDLIMAKYVFEHLERPLTAMRRLARLLRPGGIFFFSVPNTESLGARIKGDRWYARKDPTHISLMEPHIWHEYVSKANLILIKESSDGYWDVPYIRWLPRWIQLPIFIGPTAVACIVGREILPARFGENLLIIAKRPTVGNHHLEALCL